MKTKDGLSVFRLEKFGQLLFGCFMDKHFKEHPMIWLDNGKVYLGIKDKKYDLVIKDK